MKFPSNLKYKYSNVIMWLSTYDGNEMQQGEDNMARPTRCRRICMEPAYDSFFPDGFLTGEEVIMTLDEYEAIRLIDLEEYTQHECAKQMNISRTTVAEIYKSARYKMADSVVNGKKLLITGGNYQFCDGVTCPFCKKHCNRAANSVSQLKILKKEGNKMRIAVTYENGKIYQHFGHTSQFKLYDIEDGKVTSTQIVDTNGQGHGALSGFLSQGEVDILICGGIGGGAQNALAEAGIKLYGGVSGDADEAVNAYLEGKLDFNPDVQCSHHAHEHSCGGHQCGEDKHGCSGN